MPEKSIREMNKYERMHHSLAARTFHATLQSAVILCLVSLLIGLGLYMYALANRYIGDAFHLARNAASIADKVLDTGALSRDMMEIYSRLSPEERAEVGTDAYYDRYAEIEQRAEYAQLLDILQVFQEGSDADFLYVAMYDKKTSSLVYLADPDDSREAGWRIGEHEPVSQREVRRFLNWDGERRLYHISKTEQYGWLCTSGVPIRADNGQVVGFFLADVTLRGVGRAMRSFLLQYSAALLAASILLGYFLTRHMKKTLVQPINEIARAAADYVQDKRDGVPSTDHFARLNICTGDEIENLALIMADMEHDLDSFEENLTRVTAEKERIGTELSLATRIQAAMLPHIFPAFPERPDFDIYATMTPAKEVGGDFYDFFLIDDDHLGLVMADVSGKGVPAALFMMVSKILIKNHAMSGKSPGEVLTAVNEQICANNREEMFVTAWYGSLDLTTGLLKAANAGHEYPVLKKPGGAFELVKDKHSFVIGGMSGVKYREYELQLEPGARLFLYTDGVAEATNGDGKLFGAERMMAALNAAADGTPCDILSSVSGAVEAFVQDAPQFDDLTMLCIHYIGEGEPNMKELTVEATLENIEVVTDFINAELETLDCPLKAQMQIDVAIDELFGNIAHYAYDGESGKATVRFAAENDPRCAVITFIDSGKPYDPLEKDDPDTSLSAEDREVGGLGIFLVKKTMDDIYYEYRDGRNILTVKKNL